MIPEPLIILLMFTGAATWGFGLFYSTILILDRFGIRFGWNRIAIAVIEKVELGSEEKDENHIRT